MHLPSPLNPGNSRPVGPPQPPEPPLPTINSINGSRGSALLIEDDKSLLNFLKRSLTDGGYTVRTAANSEEGFRLYRECAPFSVVLIGYCVPKRDGTGVDYLAPQTHGVELATAIRQLNPSQAIIISAFDYRDGRDVPLPQALMNIHVLIEGGLQLRSLLEKLEVERALEAMRCADLLKLQKFANFRIRGLGRAARGRTGEDLLADAVLSTLIGTGASTQGRRWGRRWNKNVDFVCHLTGAMQSISNSWKRKFNEKEAYLEAEVLPMPDRAQRVVSPFENIASGQELPDKCMIAKEREARIFELFRDDSQATAILHDLANGMKKSEIKQCLGLSEKQWQAVLRRIRVRLSLRKNGPNGGRETC